MTRKYFTAETLSELKKEYRRLVMQYHPDRLGNTPEAEARMQEINAEYDRLHKILPETNASGEQYQPSDDYRGAPEEFRAAILAALKLAGVNVELCGSWIWASGETRQHAAALKAAGYKFSANKQAWYWHTPGYRKHSRKSYTLDEIRQRFGSEKYGTGSGSEREAERIAG